MKKSAWLICIATLMLFASMFLIYSDRQIFRCPGCLSEQETFQWKAGTWSSADLTLTSRKAIISPSFTASALLGLTHTHSWIFVQGSPYYVFGTKWGGCALGIGRGIGSSFGWQFEHDEEFRDFLFEKLKTGAVSTNDVVQMILVSPSAFSPVTNAPTITMWKARSNQLEEEFSRKP